MDRKARAGLILTMDSSLFVHIEESKTSKELWTELEALFDDSGFSRRIALLRHLISIGLESCEKEAGTTKELWTELEALFDDSGFSRRIALLRHLISIGLESCENVTRMVDTSQRLSGTGFKINDEWVGSLLLAGLPERFMPMIMAIEHWCGLPRVRRM